jgi:hypothetical protein
MVSITASWGSRKVFGIALFLAVYSFFLHVNRKFFDKDLVFDDRLGDAVTDADGEFYILPKLLEGVSKGERITITKHGYTLAISVTPWRANSSRHKILTHRNYAYCSFVPKASV